MAHFAEIDATNTVLRVLVVPDDEEHRGQEYMADDLDLGGTWLQTSYWTKGNVHYDADGPDGGTAVRFNYAGIGCIYDPDADVFYSPEPSEGNWTLDTETWLWVEITE
jgi:Ethanolamine utilization protein EutJ (predicted chaperonin)